MCDSQKKRFLSLISLLLVLCMLTSQTVGVAAAAADDQSSGATEEVAPQEPQQPAETSSVEQESVRINLEDRLLEFVGYHMYVFAYNEDTGLVLNDVSWTSTQPQVAEVVDGVLYLYQEGITVITATTSSGVSRSTEVTVCPVTDISLEETVVISGEDQEGYAFFRFVPEESGVYAFYSFDNDMDTVGCILNAQMEQLSCDDDSLQNNNFRCQYAMEAGQTYYLKSYTFNSGAQGSYSVTVIPLTAATGLTVEDRYTHDYYVGTQFQMHAVFSPSNAAVEAVTWSSDDPAVADVDNNGSVSLLSPGTTTIRVISEGGLTAEFPLVVRELLQIRCGETVTVSGNRNESRGKAIFIPEQTGTYQFYSFDSNVGTWGYIQDTEGNMVSPLANDRTEYTFQLQYKLTAGQTYYLRIDPTLDVGETGKYSFGMEMPPSATSMEIQEDRVFEKVVGSSFYVYGVFYPEDTAVETVTWVSSNPDVLRVSEDGFVELLAEGAATITGTSENGLTASREYQVRGATEISAGQVVTLTTQDNNGNAFFRFVPQESGLYAFYSFDNSLDTVGYVYNAQMGELSYDDDGGGDNNFRCQVELTAGEVYYLSCRPYSSDREGQYSVCVRTVVYATSMSILDQGEHDFQLGTEFRLVPEFYPENSYVETVTWSSSNSDVATVDELGQVRLISPGEATITAVSENGLTATYELQVNSGKEITLDQLYTIDIQGDMGDGLFCFVPEETGIYSFRSVDCQINTNGYILNDQMEYLQSVYGDPSFVCQMELIAGNTYYLRAQPGAYGYYTQITVVLTRAEAATGVTIVQDRDMDCFVGAIFHVRPGFLPEGALVEEVSWSSSHPEVATVDADGKVRPLQAGTTVLTLTTANGLTDSVELVVKPTQTLLCDVDTAGALDEENRAVFFAFIPEESGAYVLQSKDAQFHTVGRLYDSQMNQIYISYAGSGDTDFKCQGDLVAGEVYYLAVTANGSDVGEFTVSATRAVAATGVSIVPTYNHDSFIGTTFHANAVFYPENAMEEGYNFYSSDPSILAVESYGYVRLVGEGTASVLLTTNGGLTASYEIHVSAGTLISADETIMVDATENRGVGFFRFVPEETGVYVFKGLDTQIPGYGYIYDTSMRILAEDFGSYWEGAFRCAAELQAGQTYYLKFMPSVAEPTGQLGVRLTRVGAANAIAIVDRVQQNYYPGMSFPLTAVFLPEDSIEEAVTWSSSEPAVATVDETGMVTILTQGTAEISVVSENGLQASYTIQVELPPQLVLEQSVMLGVDGSSNVGFFSFIPEKTGTYKFYAFGSNIDTKAYLYDAQMNQIGYNDDAPGTMDFLLSSSLVAGQVYYYKCMPFSEGDSGSYSVALSMQQAATGVSITVGETYTDYVGSQVWFGVVFFPQDAAAEAVTWSSSDDSVVSISDNGVVTMLQEGTATIQAVTENGLVANCVVTVKPVDTIFCGQTLTLGADGSDNVGMYRFVPQEDGTYVFRSFDNKLDTRAYLYDGNMNALASDDDSGGNANFRIAYPMIAGRTYYLKCSPYSLNTSGQYSISLTRAIPATGMTLSLGESYSDYINTAIGVSVTFDPVDSAAETVTWSTTDANIAYVTENGVLNMVGQGIATVTATSENGLTASCVVTVKVPEPIALEEEKQVVLTSPEERALFAFTPEEDGVYAFYSYDATSVTVGQIRDIHNNVLAESVSAEDGNCFRVKLAMTAGQTYILRTNYSYSNNGSYKVQVEKATYITDLEVVSMPNRTEYVRGFVQEYLDYTGMTLKATWSDGSTSQWQGGRPNQIGDELLSIDTSMAGTDGIVTFATNNASASIQLTLNDNPVDHMELISGTAVTYTENCGGYYMPGNNGQYYYYITKEHSDALVRIYFTDGTYTDAHPGDTVNGYQVIWSAGQYATPWTLGADNPSNIDYLGAWVNLPITVEPNPVENISLTQAPSRVYYDRDPSTGWLEGPNYYPYFDDLTDIILTVDYTDGTSKVFTHEDFDMETGLLDGMSFTLQYNGGVVGENRVDLTYMNHTVTYMVTMAETPVASIEVTKAPTLQEFGYIGVSGECYGLQPDFVGMELTVHMLDGSQKTVTITRENLTYRVDMRYKHAVFADVEVDGSILSIRTDTGYNPQEKPYTIHYMGYTATYGGITFVDHGEVSRITVENPVVYGEGMVFVFHYADGTQERLPVTVWEQNFVDYDENTRLVIAESEKGLVSYVVMVSYDAEGNVEAYTFEIYQLRVCVKPEAEVKNGLVEEDGNLRYYVDGEFAATYTGVVEHTDGKYYYVVRGIHSQTKTGIVVYEAQGHYFVNGVCDFTYNGFVDHTNGAKYLIENSLIAVKNSTSAADTDGSIYKLKSGKVDTTFTAVYKHADEMLYYFVNGKVDTAFEGLVEYKGLLIIIQNGQFNKNFYGSAEHTDGKIYLVRAGYWQENYVGMHPSHLRTWLYFTNGIADYDYDGLIDRQGQKYLIRQAEIQVKYTKSYEDTDGTVYMLRYGKWNQSYTTLGNHNGKVSYFVNGVMQKDFTGLVMYNNKLRYIENGVYNTGFTGTFAWEGKTYNIVRGDAK